MTYIDDVFDEAMGMFADLMQNGTYDILRPDYSSATTHEEIVAKKTGVPVDVARGEIEAKISGVDYYVLGLPASRVKVGDVILPNPARAGVPAVTVRSVDGGGKDIIAFRTDSVGVISLSTRHNKEKYENVRYGIVSMIDPESSLAPDFEGSPDFVRTRIVFFARSGVRTGMYLSMEDGRQVILRSIEKIGPLMIAIASEKKP